jgi:hypothetical protein
MDEEDREKKINVVLEPRTMELARACATAARFLPQLSHSIGSSQLQHDNNVSSTSTRPMRHLATPY